MPRCMGRPWNSGYGAVAGIFDRHNVWPNAVAVCSLARSRPNRPSSSWPFQLLSPAASRYPGTLAEQPAIRAGLGIFVITVVMSYLPYTRFDEWTYVRFLLPAVPVLLVAAVGFVRGLKARVGQRDRDGEPDRRRDSGVRVGNHNRPVAWRVHRRQQRGAFCHRRARCRDDDAREQRRVLDVPFRQRAVLRPPDDDPVRPASRRRAR